MPPRVSIVLRTCSRVHSLSHRPRMGGFQKPEVVLRCLRSLGRSMSAVVNFHDYLQLHIVDDASDTADVVTWKRALEQMGVQAEWSRTDSRTGRSSFDVATEIAEAQTADAIYFVEDDYLHYPEALGCVLASFKELQRASANGEIALTTYDCPDRYRRGPYPATIEFAGGRYWRTVRHTTGTFLVSRSTLQRHLGVYQKFGDYGRDPSVCEDTTINTVYRQIPCFSPIPTLTIHLQYDDTLPLMLPRDGWKALWDRMASDGGEAAQREAL